MKNEKYILLFFFYLVLFTLYIVYVVGCFKFYSNGINKVISYLSISIMPLCLLIGSFISKYMIIKYELKLKKHIIYYLITIIISVLIVVLSFEPMFQSSMPLVALAFTIVFLHITVKDFKSRLVLILCSPIIYYLIFILSFAISFRFSSYK